jgi:uncharacterized tellurite resistance protein B-like protein
LTWNESEQAQLVVVIRALGCLPRRQRRRYNAAMFGRWLKLGEAVHAPPGAELLGEAVRRELPQADDATVLVVTAMAGLLGAIAFADRNYSNAEEARIRQELERVQGITASGIDAICAVLRQHIVEVSTVQAPRYSRVLVELADRELRLEVLGLMLEIAVADGAIAHAEVNVLRQITKALGLSQDDYNELQSKHQARLTVLK